MTLALRALGALLVLALAAPGAAHAQQAEVAFGGLRADTSLPVEVTADTLSVNQTDGTATFSGNVLVVQGDMRLSAERVEVVYGSADRSRIECIYFTMSEENLRKQIVEPWLSFASDASSLAPEGVFLKSNPHPRAYGTFARVLGKYTRDEGVLSLPEAVRKLTSLPASNLRLSRRGTLAPGYFADVVVFDPATITDHATFDRPHQYATGVRQVFVNGAQVIQDGEHTGRTPGRVVKRGT